LFIEFDELDLPQLAVTSILNLIETLSLETEGIKQEPNSIVESSAAPISFPKIQS
jgi:hypothetical protein